MRSAAVLSSIRGHIKVLKKGSTFNNPHPKCVAVRICFCICLILYPLPLRIRIITCTSIRRQSLNLHRDPEHGIRYWGGVFMIPHRPDAEMEEAPLEGLSVLIRGHYLYTVSRSWLVTSQSRARLAGLQGESQKGKEGGPRPAAENVISRLGGETNSCCQPDLVNALEEPE